MKLLFLAGVIVLCVALIFKASYDAAQMRDDYQKYGGDYLIKAISEYNSKTTNGPIGSPGVTRTPLTNYGPGSKNQNPQKKVGQPAYNSQPTYKGGGYIERPISPSKPYYPSQTPIQSGGTKRNDAGGDGYYPPPPADDQPADGTPPPAPQSSIEGGKAKPYLARDIPQQDWSNEKLRLPSGQKVGFNGMDVFTYDKGGNRVVMPDGYYQVGGMRMHVQDGKKVIYEE